jgi:TRAP-type mannitol/chloroaromatic compound transport system permease large subunit
VLDFIEITFVVVPIVAPVLLTMGLDPVWLGIMIAVNLQTSFLTPPFGFALFYLRGVAPPEVTTAQIYRGVIPFVVIQLLAMLILAAFPALVTWLPQKLYSS